MTTEITQPLRPKTRHPLIRWIAGSALVALAAGFLTGCFVETVRPHGYHHHRVVIWR